jgi:hypothetical protein
MDIQMFITSAQWGRERERRREGSIFKEDPLVF